MSNVFVSSYIFSIAVLSANAVRRIKCFQKSVTDAVVYM